MADTSPGKVQALKAMFSQKDSPVMGLMPCNGKLDPRPWKSSATSLNDDKNRQLSLEDKLPASNAAACVVLKTLQVSNLVNKNGTKTNYNSDTSCDKKPAVGPKPQFLKQPCRTLTSPLLNSAIGSPGSRLYENNLLRARTKSDGIDYRKNCDAIASFMFPDESKNTVSNPKSNLTTKLNVDPSVPAPVSSDYDVCPKAKMAFGSPMSLINSDNYICKSSYALIRNELPPKDKIKSPPPKPPRPSHVRLPGRFLEVEPSCTRETLPLTTTERPSLQHLMKSAHHSISKEPQFLPKPTYPCPPRPTTSPPVPPSLNSQGKPEQDLSFPAPTKTLLEEIEELYEDTLLQDILRRPTSLIPEYSVEEETCELYDDADQISVANESSRPMKPKHPPPPPPSLPSLYPNPVTEELYQDAVELTTDEVYEEMPMDPQEEDHYSNNKKEFEKMKRDEEKRLRKEVKEREKKEKEFDKIKKKFGLTGEELPIDTGLVKSDSRGGKSDLSVKKGDTVYILRIEGNPAGKWLVRNKKGKYGFVELTNIEVDPDSVKSVMTIRRTSVISVSEELYSEAYSDEGIYEMTY